MFPKFDGDNITYYISNKCKNVIGNLLDIHNQATYVNFVWLGFQNLLFTDLRRLNFSISSTMFNIQFQIIFLVGRLTI